MRCGDQIGTGADSIPLRAQAAPLKRRLLPTKCRVDIDHIHLRARPATVKPRQMSVNCRLGVGEISEVGRTTNIDNVGGICVLIRRAGAIPAYGDFSHRIADRALATMCAARNSSRRSRDIGRDGKHGGIDKMFVQSGATHTLLGQGLWFTALPD